MDERRQLKFDTLADVVLDTETLLSRGYDRRGEWSLGQICQHLMLVQDPSVDGYPKWMSLFSFLRPAMRRWLLPKLLSDDSPRGIRTASAFMPPADTDDAVEVANFRNSVAKLLQHKGDYAPHPAFGRMPRERILQIHCSHAAHHLRFLIPRE